MIEITLCLKVRGRAMARYLWKLSLISQCESQNFHIIWSDRQIHLFSGDILLKPRLFKYDLFSPQIEDDFKLWSLRLSIRFVSFIIWLACFSLFLLLHFIPFPLKVKVRANLKFVAIEALNPLILLKLDNVYIVLILFFKSCKALSGVLNVAMRDYNSAPPATFKICIKT